MKKDQTKRQNEILDATLHLIAEKGIRNLTIRHLSQAMHITDAALYYYFQDKPAIIQPLVSRFEGEADAAGEDLHGWAALEAAVIHRTELVLPTPDLADLNSTRGYDILSTN